MKVVAFFLNLELLYLGKTTTILYDKYARLY